MQVTLEETSEIARRIVISVPSQDVDDEISQRLAKTRPRVRLNGFRPGRVPLREVRRRFGADIRREVTDELIQKSFFDAMEEAELTPAAAPDIRDVQNEAGRDLTFTAEFEVYPKVELRDFSGIQVTRSSTEITDPDLDAMIEDLRRQRLTYETVARPARRDDQVTIDFSGKVDGEAFSGGEAENFSLVLGSGRMLEGFETALEGLVAEAETEIRLSFPKDYHASQLAGREALFQVRVHQVAEPRLPEVDETFYASFGVGEGGEEAFRTEVRGNMRREVDGVIRARLRDQVMRGLSAAHDLTLPKGLVKAEMRRMQADFLRRIGRDADQPLPEPPDDSPFRGEAEERVKLGLIVREIVRTRELKVDDGKVRARIEAIAATYQEPQQIINWYYGNEQELEHLGNLVLEEQVVDLVVAECQVTDRQLGYQELMKPASGEPATETTTKAPAEVGAQG